MAGAGSASAVSVKLLSSHLMPELAMYDGWAVGRQEEGQQWEQVGTHRHEL